VDIVGGTDKAYWASIGRVHQYGEEIGHPRPDTTNDQDIVYPGETRKDGLHIRGEEKRNVRGHADYHTKISAEITSLYILTEFC
jgi:hypothetical protein